MAPCLHLWQPGNIIVIRTIPKRIQSNVHDRNSILMGSEALAMRINGVFEGGGVKGIALVGAAAVTVQKGFEFDRMAGTSSGSIVASFIAAGYSPEEMKRIILESPFSSFLHKSILHHLAFIGPAIRLLLKKGIYSGDPLEAWIRQKLLAKGVRTFGDLPPDKLYIVASDITNGELLVLPEDLKKYGINPNQFEVARAVRMSISIPYFFDPVVLKKNYVVDGGILSNFPLWIFDEEHKKKNNEKLVPTLGYQLVGRNRHPKNDINGPITMLQALFSTMMGAHDERYIEKEYRYRTIKIDASSAHTTEFDLSKEQSLKLYASGFEAAEEFFARWSYSQYLTQFQQYLRNLQV